MDASSLVTLLALLLMAAASVFYLALWPGMRRRRILARPFPAAWLAILNRKLPIYAGLSRDERRRLQDLVKEFINDKPFFGCAGQAIDDEVRVTIAAQGCLLALNRPPGPLYPRLRSILVYPSTFVATRETSDEAGVVSTHRDELHGESWDSDKVILAWDDVESSARDPQDGYNVVLHEFAHQLDSESGEANGTPALPTRAAHKRWREVFLKEYEALKLREAQDQPGLLDTYGAADPAEFFAVATETFFERPMEMATHHQALYRELADYYGTDPARWHNRCAEARVPRDLF